MGDLFVVGDTVIVERRPDVTVDQIPAMIDSGYFAAVFRVVGGVVEYAFPNALSGRVEWIEATVPE